MGSTATFEMKVTQNEAFLITNFLLNSFDGNTVYKDGILSFLDSEDLGAPDAQLRLRDFMVEQIRDFSYILYVRDEISEEEYAVSVRRSNGVMAECQSQKYIRVKEGDKLSLEDICDQYDLDYETIDKDYFTKNRNPAWLGKMKDTLVHEIPWKRTKIQYKAASI